MLSYRHMNASTLHEDLDRDEQIRPLDPRAVGFVFAVAFAVFGFAPLVRSQRVRIWYLLIALAFGITALIRPQTLRPLAALWQRLGMLLNRVISPLVLAIVFGIIIVPMGLILRMLRKTSIEKRPATGASSYWLVRARRDPTHMRRQF